ncbi:hypothetical protein [Zobellella taiwanensis]|jgi:hypothetical protein|uniref:Uncharacterized protein n=1 Tax=Zobellella taiwanensis TaxID=347535 RepID=A0A2P7QU76_9GAMM|nr:hypothetical protein [Zobellella taiwanensis]PSJ41508.1 hypothetical protein C7I36_10245 [Zobellella taiwanensis]
MTKIWLCGVLALTLSGCSLPLTLPFKSQPEPAWSPASDNGELLDWLQLAAEVMASDEAERGRQLRQLQQAGGRDELRLALWLSHPRASLAQRQQAQQLFSQQLPAVNTRLQQFFAVYQSYNRELISLNRQVADRQQQVNTLTRKLNELATIDEQINERRYQESGQ